ncbi:MAG: class I SAM-dependent methyltransferase [Acidiferrobacter sp.]
MGSSDSSRSDLRRFDGLTFDDFRRMALDPSLTDAEKIGFPDSYRRGKEGIIYEDIVQKLTLLQGRGHVVVDIGPGCGALPRLLSEVCGQKGHTLIFIDSQEMLNQLPEAPFVRKVAARFPDCPELLSELRDKVDVVLSYSVLHYIFSEANVWSFFDKALSLLAPGGQLLLGDIPNISKRTRFFASEAGVAYHQAFTGGNSMPLVSFNKIEHDKIDDSVLIGLVARARAAGFDAYLMRQGTKLPMANRREDLLVERP